MIEPWKKRLYDKYVSSGQAAAHAPRPEAFDPRHFPYYQRLIQQHVPADRSVSVVDLACGHGSLLRCLQAAGYTQVSGVDISPEQVELAHASGLHNVACGNLFDYLQGKRDCWDVVLLMDILEHLDRAELFDLLDAVAVALRDGGRVIIHVPNAEGLYGARIRYGDLTHEMSFTSSSMRQALIACGFRSVRAYEDVPVSHGVKGILRRWAWRILTAPARLTLYVETGERGFLLSQNMLVVAQK